MKSLKEIMGDYLDGNENPHVGVPLNEIAMQLSSTSNDYPVSPLPGRWETVSDPVRFMKKFEFKEFTIFKNFLDEVMAYQEDVQHHAKITIDGYDVIIEVYTHDVNTVTELDQEYIHEVDNILRDVQYYNEEDVAYVKQR